MSKRKSKNSRVDPDFEREMRKLTMGRLKKGLIKSNKPADLGLPRATSRLLNCPSWQDVKLEYLNLPEKKKNERKKR